MSRSRALRRVAALRRACALGGVSLAVLAPAAHAQTPRPQAADARAEMLRYYGVRETADGQIVPVRSTPAGGRVRPANAAAHAAQRGGGGPTFGPGQANPFGLAPFRSLAPSYGSDPAVADLDGDGDLDVLSGSSNGSFSFFANTAGPGAPAAFTADVANPFGLTSDTDNFRPTVGDLDGDGDLDVLIGRSGGSFGYYENTAGAGNAPAFAAPVTNPFGLTALISQQPPPFNASEASPRLVDLDGDGDLDVLAGDKDGNLVYFQNVPAGGVPAFAAAQTNPFGLSDVGDIARPAVGDVDGDGDLDVLVGNKQGNATYFANTAGPGTTPAFAPSVVGAFGLPSNGGSSTLSPTLVDLDADGDLDVLAGGTSGTLRLFANTAAAGTTPAFGPAQPNPNGLTPVRTLSPAQPTTLAQADFDGDGDLDVLAAVVNGGFFLFDNTAGAGAVPAFSAAQPSPFGLTASGTNQTIAVGDLDGDGDLDVLTIVNNSQFVYFENTAGQGATPAFSAGQTNPFGLLPTSTIRVPTLGDIDGDGDLDVLVGDGSYGNFTLFQNTSGPQNTPLFGPPQTNPFGLTPVNSSAPLFQRGGTSSGGSAPAFTDLDGDGDLDVVSGSYDGRIFVFTNTAGPRETPAFVANSPGAFGLPNTPSYGVLTAVASDLDGDGDTDLLTSISFEGFIYYENTGTVGPVTARLDGTTGYRMLAAPTATPLGTLLGSEIFTQGFSGAAQEVGPSTVYLYDETVSGDKDLGYVAPAAITSIVGAGRGAFVYVFADEDPRTSAPGQQGGFPKTLTDTGRPDLVDFDWGAGGDAPLSFTDSGLPADDGWNLLGNPFGSWFDWDAVDLANVNAPVYVYDNATANYLAHSRGIPGAGSLPGGIVGPFQGFWVQANAANPAITSRPGVSNGGPLYRGDVAPTVVGLRLRPGAGSGLPEGVQSEAFLALGVDGAEAGADTYDALALVPPAQSFVLLAAGGHTIDARPEAPGIVAVPLDVSAVVDGAEAGSALVLDWPSLDLPDGWRAELRDAATGARIDLATATEYAFTLAGPAAVTPRRDALAIPRLGGAPHPAEARGGDRFTLVVTPAGFTDAAPDAATTLALSAPRPNPTTGAASFMLSLPEASDVRVAVYDVLGREVAVLADAQMSAGETTVRVTPGALAAGTYVVRATVAGHVLTQRLTVTR